MKKNDITYIIKRILIGVGIGIILMLFRTNVFALNDNCTDDVGKALAYKKFGSSSWVQKSDASQFNDSGVQFVRFRITEPDLTTHLASVQQSFWFKIYGWNRPDYTPDIQVRYGTTSNNVNITSYCNISLTRDYQDGETPNNYTEFSGNIYCNYAGTISNASMYEFTWTISDINVPLSSLTFYRANPVVCIEPSDLDLTLENLKINRQMLESYINNSNNELLQNIYSEIQASEGRLEDEFGLQLSQFSSSLITSVSSSVANVINSQQVCKKIENKDVDIKGYFLNSNGVQNETVSDYGITKYINIENSTIKAIIYDDNTIANFCFYKNNKTKINCISNNNAEINTMINIPDEAYYVRFSIRENINKPNFEICTNGNQAINDAFKETFDFFLSDDPIDVDSDGYVCSGNSCPKLEGFGPLDTMLNLPKFFYNRLREELLSGMSEGIRISKNDLPFYRLGIYRNVSFDNGDYVLPPLRNLAFNFVSNTDSSYNYSEFYDYLGTLFGNILLWIFFIKKGKAIMRMGRLGTTDNESWGGIE